MDELMNGWIDRSTDRQTDIVVCASARRGQKGYLIPQSWSPSKGELPDIGEGIHTPTLCYSSKPS